MARVGRPRKKNSEKIEYQLIAVHVQDYRKFIEKANSTGLKKVHAFHDMVKKYEPVAKVTE